MAHDRKYDGRLTTTIESEVPLKSTLVLIEAAVEAEVQDMFNRGSYEFVKVG